MQEIRNIHWEGQRFEERKNTLFSPTAIEGSHQCLLDSVYPLLAVRFEVRLKQQQTTQQRWRATLLKHRSAITTRAENTALKRSSKQFHHCKRLLQAMTIANSPIQGMQESRFSSTFRKDKKNHPQNTINETLGPNPHCFPHNPRSILVKPCHGRGTMARCQ